MEISNINNPSYSVAGRFCGCQNNDNSSFARKNISFKGFPKTADALKWVANNFSSPHQRAILGVTALCTQPFIDLYNRHIKKEDKPITVAKTIAKIIVGTTIGIALRHYAIKAVKKYTNAIYSGKYSQCLLPKKIAETLKTNPKAIDSHELQNYINGIGTFLGVMGGLVTNFAVDAPLTKKLTNLIHDNVFKKEKKNV